MEQDRDMCRGLRISGVSVKSVVLYLLLSGIVVGAWSCHSGPSAKEKLRQRVSEYWGLKADGKLIDAYKFEYPTYRKLVTVERYVANYNPEAKTGRPTIKAITINEDQTAKVELKMPVKLKPPFIKKPFETNVTFADKWMMIDGMWYHVPTAQQRKILKERG